MGIGKHLFYSLNTRSITKSLGLQLFVLFQSYLFPNGKPSGPSYGSNTEHVHKVYLNFSTTHEKALTENLQVD